MMISEKLKRTNNNGYKCTLGVDIVALVDEILNMEIPPNKLSNDIKSKEEGDSSNAYNNSRKTSSM